MSGASGLNLFKLIHLINCLTVDFLIGQNKVLQFNKFLFFFFYASEECVRERASLNFIFKNVLLFFYYFKLGHFGIVVT